MKKLPSDTPKSHRQDDQLNGPTHGILVIQRSSAAVAAHLPHPSNGATAILGFMRVDAYM